MSKNKNLTIYLMHSNIKNFKSYLKNQYQNKVKKHYLDKDNLSTNIEKGMIYLYEETLSPPEWIQYLNELSLKKNIEITEKKTTKSVLFLRVKGVTKKTFAITFGNGSTLLDPEYVISDFGQKIAKCLLSVEELVSIDTTSLDKKMFNTKKQSAAFLMPEKLLEFGTQNIVKNVYGIYKEFNKKFSLGGNESLNFRGDIDLLKDLDRWLIQFIDLYVNGQESLSISNDLLPVNKSLQQTLDNKLGDKILNIISCNIITKVQTKSLKISPPVTFDLENFNGFFIEGLGYKNSDIASDFYIDELNFFERLKRQLKITHKNIPGILRKIKTDKIHRKIDEVEDTIPICSIYKAINYELTYNQNLYILVFGKWYEIDRSFYGNLKKDINAIENPDTDKRINFIDFDSSIHFKMKKGKQQANEGKYNEDFSETNHILMLDREDYRVDTKTMKHYGFKSQSSIELCDALYFDKNILKFIHVKRHSGASGTSHLLTQALVSAHAFVNDTEAVKNHINKTIKKFNTKSSSYKLLELKNTDQNREVILAIIDTKKNIKKASGENSKLLSLLEMISLRANVRTLEFLGFKCYLKFIPGDTK